MERIYNVKARKRTGKQYKFVSADGSLNRLRIHAALMTGAEANEFMAQTAPMNPEYEFKMVDAFGEGK